ncbi:MAG: hypothetical protein HQL32_04685 [Planctomycetes bacterium]|nr:hypothetical protein [Planctomycetota bacterium]
MSIRLAGILFVLMLVNVNLLSDSSPPKSLGLIPENFLRENLVPWCIVPYDVKERSPAQRAAMLSSLGLKRCAYDWRPKHIPEFPDEIKAYKKHGIDFFVFWKGHPSIYPMFRQNGLKPQIWKTLPKPKAKLQGGKLAEATNAMLPLAQTCKREGLKLGLYNHGGWTGEPKNLIAVCKALRADGYKDVGIVYNFHHAHHDLEDFSSNFKLMLPYLLCLNLNGMTLPNAEDFKKIRLIGSGVLEQKMIAEVIESGYDGPIGILGHVEKQDVEVVLKNNIEGLENILKKICVNR